MGVVPTLLARLLEVRFKATTLLFVTRRSWPGDVKLLHGTQESFMKIAACAAVVWHTGLAVLAYNGQVAQWGLLPVCGVWFGTAAGLIFLLCVAARCLNFVRGARHESCSACFFR